MMGKKYTIELRNNTYIFFQVEAIFFFPFYDRDFFEKNSEYIYGVIAAKDRGLYYSLILPLWPTSLKKQQ